MFAPLYILSACISQTPTVLTIAVSPGVNVDYSDALAVTATLTAHNAGVGPKRIEWSLHNAHNDSQCSLGFMTSVADDGTTGPLRVRFVDGACGMDSYFADDSDGAPYTIEARFAGDAEFLAAEASEVVYLHRESVAVLLPPEQSAKLFAELPLFATLVDENGDAELAGTSVSGREAKPVGNARLFFYIDLNDDGDFADIDEDVGQATTGSNGTASVLFNTTPFQGLPHAGFHRDALRVEFSGDDRYKIAVAIADLRFEVAAPDASMSLVEALPNRVPADGKSVVTLSAQLRDQAGNLYGADAAVHDVRFVSTLGSPLGRCQRIAADGSYQQELEAPLSAGTAVVSIVVDEQKGATTEIDFYAESCACNTSVPTAQSCLLCVFIALFESIRLRWRAR